LSILWSPEALADVGAAIDYLVDRNAPAALRLAINVTTCVERLAADPVDGPEHVLANGERVRGWPYPPFRIYYQRTGEDLLVVRVYHQRREPIVR
jgi:plasmid stabilization system protein ParE